MEEKREPNKRTTKTAAVHILAVKIVTSLTDGDNHERVLDSSDSTFSH